MHNEKLAFINKDLFNFLNDTNAATASRWGKMNAQQMIEHLTAFFKVSSGKIKFELVTPEVQLPKYREFLFSDKALRENTRAPLSVIGEAPLPVRNPSYEIALQELRQSVNEFIDYFKDDPAQTTLHPVFGPLNFEEWILLHHKHLQHHLKQFGLPA